ncbi:hypothetical protein, partial [Prevotella nigrescens]|uniref:hypothetical protein n=1 Tax=Prevotella nigrescens TaxID=28133 RepID=UPI0028E664B2
MSSMILSVVSSCAKPLSYSISKVRLYTTRGIRLHITRGICSYPTRGMRLCITSKVSPYLQTIKGCEPASCQLELSLEGEANACIPRCTIDRSI